jgi:hypothetical protein
MFLAYRIFEMSCLAVAVAVAVAGVGAASSHEAALIKRSSSSQYLQGDHDIDSSTVRNAESPAAATAAQDHAQTLALGVSGQPQLFLLSRGSCIDLGDFQLTTGGEFPGAVGALQVSFQPWRERSVSLVACASHAMKPLR